MTAGCPCCCPSRARPGCLAPRPGADPRLRALHHRSASSPPSGSASGAGWPAAAGTGRSATSPSGRCRSASSARGSTTSPPTTTSTSAPARTPGALYDLARRPRHLGRDRRSAPSAPGWAAGTTGIKMLPLMDALAPGLAAGAGDRPLGQLLQPGAVRPARPTSRGRSRSTRRTGRPGYREVRDLPPDVPLRVRCGTSARSASWSGPTGGSGSASAARSRSTSWATAWAGSGSSTCASTPSS